MSSKSTEYYDRLEAALKSLEVEMTEGYQKNIRDLKELLADYKKLLPENPQPRTDGRTAHSLWELLEAATTILAGRKESLAWLFEQLRQSNQMNRLLKQHLIMARGGRRRRTPAETPAAVH